MSFENVFTHGNLVDLNISMWSGERKLQPEDLGLESKDLSGIFSLGRKKLVPSHVIEKMRRLDSKARDCLIKNSVSFEFGGARFVPKKRFLDFVEGVEKIIEEFNREADSISENYTKYKLEVRKEYVEAASTAYERLSTLHKGLDVDKNTFINNFLERIDKAYPSASEIRSKYRMEYVVFQAALPDLSRASYDDIIEESEKVKLLEEVYRKSLYNRVNSFIEKTLTSQREKATGVLKGFLDRLTSDKVIYEPAVNLVKDMIVEYEKMDFIGDTEFTNKLKNFKRQSLDIYKANDFRSNTKLRESVSDQIRILINDSLDRDIINEISYQYRMKIKL